MTGAAVARARPDARRRGLAVAAALLLCALPAGGLRLLARSAAPASTGGSGVVAAAVNAGLPASALAPISAAIGAAEPAYRFQSAPGAIRGANPAQRLGIRFSRTGATIDAPGGRVSLSARAAGFGGSLHALEAVTATAHGNRVTYFHRGLSEWYVNGPLGLEQGFTVAQPRARPEAADPLTLQIALSAGVSASLAEAGRSVRLSSGNGGLLRYGGLRAVDAANRTLPSRLSLHGHTLSLQVNVAGARFPVVVDPMITSEAPEAKLTQAVGEARSAAKFGISTAISGDGRTAIVGAPDVPTGDGAAWVFVRSGETWVQQGPELTVNATGSQKGHVLCSETSSEEEEQEEGQEEQGQGCAFGRSVAISGDGNTALVGDPRDDSGLGAAWIFTRSGSTWTQSAELSGPPAGTAEHFGKSVALSEDGSTALVGAPVERGDHGEAWVFSRTGAGWPAQGEALVGNGQTGEAYFGVSVALSGNGQLAVVGAPGNADHVGTASLFELLGSAWVQRGPNLTGAGEVGEGRFGCCVAISSSGTALLIGARTDNQGLGAAWAFDLSGEHWPESGVMLTGEGEAEEAFGDSVALSADGELALIGAPHAEASRGAAWLLERSGTSWSGARVHLEGGASEVGKGIFGTSTSISADGQSMLVGGPGDAAKAGAAWVFGPLPQVSNVNPDRGPAAGGTSVVITGANFQEVRAVRFGSSRATSFQVASSDSLVAVSPAGEGAVDVTVETAFGTSVASSLDEFTYAASKQTGGGKSSTGKSGSGGSGGGALPSGFTSFVPAAASAVLGAKSSAPACRAALKRQRVSVQAGGRATVTLLGTGTGRCAGRLSIRATVTVARKRTQTRTVGSTSFSIRAGSTITVTVKLNSAGRSLLAARHGRLSAKLLIAGAPPRPLKSYAASITLSRQAAKKPQRRS